MQGSPLFPDPSEVILMHVLGEDVGVLIAEPVDQAVLGLFRRLGPLGAVGGKTRIAKPFEMEDKPLDGLPRLVAHRPVKNDGADLLLESGQRPSRPRQQVSEKQGEGIARGPVEPGAACGRRKRDHPPEESRLRLDAPFVYERGGSTFLRPQRACRPRSEARRP